jgi:hypothetical protein
MNDPKATAHNAAGEVRGPDYARTSRGLMHGGRVTLTLLIVLFAAGALHWMLFLHYGHLSFKAHDWGKEFIYYSLIRQWITTGQVPYHVSLAFHGTERFLALPEVNLSPQVLLLPLMSIGTFVLLNTLILYAVGFVGCLMIRQRYGLSLIPFTVLFLIYNFNGHITAHIGVGHSMWASYFLLPFYCLFVLEIAEGRISRLTAIKLAFTMFAILLQGGFHIFLWCMTFLLLLLLFNWRYLKTIVWTIVYTLLLSAFRLVPAVIALLGKKEKFIWSYPTVRDLLDALITIRQQTPERLRPWGTTGWWEYDIYVGILALVIIGIFGIWLRFSKRTDLQPHKYGALDLPLFIMSLFSLSYLHAFLTRLPIPLLRSERVATRFIIVPIVMLVFISSIRLEHVLRGVKRSVGLIAAAVGGMIIIALGYADHSFLWSVTRLERIYASRTVDLAIPSLLSRPDTVYKSLLWISWTTSVAAVAGLIYLAFRMRRGGKRA